MISLIFNWVNEFFISATFCFVICFIAYIEERNIIRDYENGEEDTFKLRPYNSLRFLYKQDRGKYMKSLNDLIKFCFFIGCGCIIAGFLKFIIDKLF